MERELADLLIKMGVNSGLEMERAAEEIAVLSFPSFVNARSFRAAVLESVEAHMRLQMEERLQAMRQRFEAPGHPYPDPAGNPDMKADPAVARHDTPAVGRVPVDDAGSLDTIIGDLTEHGEGTSEDTIVWSPRRD